MNKPNLLQSIRKHTDAEEEVRGDSASPDCEILMINRLVGPLRRERPIDRQHNGTNKSANSEGFSSGHAISEVDTTASTERRSERVSQVKDKLHVGVISDSLVNIQVEIACFTIDSVAHIE